MRSWVVAILMLVAPSLASAQGLQTISSDWKIEVMAEFPTVKYCSVVCCAPDGRIFLAEDPMDQVGPPDKPGDRILCRQLDGTWTVFADKLYAVFGLQYLDGKLFVHHCPKLSVFDDAGTVGKNRVDLIECTNPKPWAGMNDHIPSGIRLGMDGWIYMSTGDKGIYGAVGRDGSKAEIHGGGIMRLRPDGTHLEVYTTGSRNHLEVAIDAEDEKFTYDNTDDGLGWNTRFTHMVDGGYYGYPYDYRTRKPYTLWMIADYGGGSPTGGVAYNEDALPKAYRGNLFMLEWGKGQLVRFEVERKGASFAIKQRDNIVNRVGKLAKGSKDEFRPVGVTISPDGMSFYIADWNFNGWSNKKGPAAGRLIKVSWTGKSQAAPKPDWLVPAAMGQPFKATNEQLIEALSHPAQSVRLVAMRRLADRGPEVVPLVVKVLQDKNKPAEGRWSAIWTLDRIDSGKAGRAAIIAALDDADLSVRRQAARQLGERSAREATPSLVKLMNHSDRSVRFQAATALGRVGDLQGVAALLPALDDTDLFARYASFTALNRIGRSEPKAWPAIVAGLDSDKAPVREATLFAFRDAYDVAAVDALSSYAADPQKSPLIRKAIAKMLADLDLQAPAWNGKWWNIKPAASAPPAHTVSWPGTAKVQDALRAGLRDPEAQVRQGTAEAMVASSDPVLTIDLLNYVPKEKDAQTRRNMLGILAAVKKPNVEFTKAGNRLAAEVLSDSKMDAQFVLQALTFAVNLPSVTPELTDALMKRANSDLPPAQLVTLLEALSKVKSTDVTSTILAQMKHADEGVRSAGVRLLTRRAEKKAAEALISALQDKSPLVRKEAVSALTTRKDKDAVPALLERMTDGDLRFDVINALAQTPDVRALFAYLEGLDGKNVDQRADCAKAVAALKKEALPAIEARLAEKPSLSADVIVQLQKVYANDTLAAKSRLFSIEVSALALGEYAAAVAKLTGNAERGHKIFFDAKGAACSKCHSVNKVGGDVGPDLSSIGFKYNRLQLIDEVLYPSKNILDGYESFAVELISGRVLVGNIRSETADELNLIDATGAKHSIKQSDVENKKRTGKSVMPDGLQGGLTPADFADLISYLETLRDKAPELPKKTGRVAPRAGPGFLSHSVQADSTKWNKGRDSHLWISPDAHLAPEARLSEMDCLAPASFTSTHANEFLRQPWPGISFDICQYCVYIIHGSPVLAGAAGAADQRFTPPIAWSPR
jgi:putative membrane-bound dehydrogenase-like protein